MKRYLLSAILLLAIFIDGFAQNNVMYVYRNDGVINSFFKEEIDSIRWSYLDIDSVAHEDYVCQEVWTADSIYRIPLELVDSVSFVTPKTVLNEGVVDIAKSMWEYVLRSEEQTFILSPSIPSGLIPAVGTKLVYMKMDEKFPGGFAGEVSAVNSTAEGFSVVCNDVKLEDIFDTFYSTTSVYGYTDDEMSTAKADSKRVEEFGDETFRLPTIRYTQSAELSKNVLSRDLAIKGGTSYELNMFPQFRVRTSLIINKEMGVYHSASIYGDITVRQFFTLYGGLEFKKDFLDPDVVISPVAPFTYFYLKPGLFVTAEVDATLSATLTQRYTTAMAYDYSSKGENMLNPTCGGRLADSSLEVEGSIDGKIALGGFIEAGVTFVKSDLDKLSARCELGGELVGHAVLYNSEIDALDKETKTYEKFKKSKFELNAFVHSFAEAKVGLWGIKKSLPWDLSYNIKTWDVVPTFSYVTLRKNSENPTHVDAYSEMSGDCLIPVGVGFSLFDGKKNLWDTYSSRTKFDNGYKYINHTFSSTQSGNKYIVYPTVTFLGFKMLANPKAEIELDEHAPKAHITNFKQTGAAYQKQGYKYDYWTYDYKFDFASTVSIDKDVDLSTVEDWGYVYKDAGGYSTHVSLMSHSSSYTDNRSAYSNNYSATVTLYGYIKYYGDYNYYYEEPHEYTLKYQEESTTLREYLVRLYQTTDGDNWYSNDNWCTEAPIHTWYGIHEENGIYLISLWNNNLSGYIDMSGCKEKFTLRCDGIYNQLTSVDVSGCTALTAIDIPDLDSLNVSGCTELRTLGANGKITDASGCTSLEKLHISYNITSVNASGCTALENIEFYSHKLTNLNVSGCTALKQLRCHQNQLTNLDLSGCTNITELGCFDNQLKSLDISSCTALERLDCGSNQLTSLNLSGYMALKYLSCSDNQISNLDVSGCTSLEFLSCQSNKFTSLDVSGCTALEVIDFAFNPQLTNFKASNTAITGFTLVSTELQSIDFSDCKALKYVDAYGQLTSLDVSGCTALTSIRCSKNQLTSLDVSGCAALTSLSCDYNQLTSLDTSGCTALEYLSCHSNQLTSLSISGCTALKDLICSNNQLNHVIDGEFAILLGHDHNYDQKYYYDNVYAPNGSIKEVRYTTNPYGWWFPGEPGKGYHRPD